MNEITKNILNNKLYKLAKFDEKAINDIFIFLQNEYQSIFTNYSVKKINIKTTLTVINKSHFSQKLSTILVAREYIMRICRNKNIAKYVAKVYNTNTAKDEFHTMISINTSTLKKLFLCFSMLYNLDCAHSKSKNMIGIDFEFNAQKIALCQIGFYPHRKYKYTFVIDPRDFNTQETQLLISTVFVSEHSYKIMHGSDSLDIPYIYEELFQGNRDLIFQFTKSLVDTRFLCEFFKIVTEYPDKKCSLYDALKFFDVINHHKYLELENINKIIGPIYDVKWNVNSMSSYHLKYASYDVVFLKMFVQKIFKKCYEFSPDVALQMKFISPIFRLWCYEKYNLSEITSYAKITTDPLNNYIIGDTTMINVFNDIVSKLIYVPTKMKFENFLQINNFKKMMMYVYKLIIYHNLQKNYTIHSNKKEVYDGEIKIINFENLHSLKLDKIVRLLEYFYEYSATLIKEISNP